MLMKTKENLGSQVLETSDAGKPKAFSFLQNKLA